MSNTFGSRRGQRTPSKQKGASLIIVLVLLAAMLMGVASLARVGEANTLIAGNTATKDAALQASEVGVAEAFQAIQALATPDTSQAAWYSATYSRANDSAAGLPSTVNWTNNSLRRVSVGTAPSPVYTVRYFVERMCSVTPVTDANNQCMVKKAYSEDSSKAGVELLEATPGVQYRITVNVAGPKESSTFVQALVVN